MEKKGRKPEPKTGFCSMEASGKKKYTRVLDPLTHRIKQAAEYQNLCLLQREDLESRRGGGGFRSL